MSRVPPAVKALLAELAIGLPAILEGSLVGIYVYGSLTQRAFDPHRSDVDCIAVTRRALTAAQFKQTAAWLIGLAQTNPWAAQLQLSFFQQSQIMQAGGQACLFQHGQLSRCGTDGNSIVWANVLRSGITLYGPAPQSFVPPVSRGQLNHSLRVELEYLREEICSADSKWRGKYFYRAYAVLTLCRILYSWRRGTVTSKPVAAHWALRQLPQFADLILQALNGTEPDSSRKLPLRSVAALIGEVDVQMRAAD